MNKYFHLFARACTSVVLTALTAGTLLIGQAQAQDTAQLNITDGVIVKFGSGAGLYVRDRLITSPNVILTSAADDQAGGQTGADPGAPARSDWLGVIVDPGVTANGLSLDGLSLRYGGGTAGLPSYLNGGAGLSIPGGDYSFSQLQLINNTTGVRVIGSGAPHFTQSRLSGNATGLLAEQGATPGIDASDISGNSNYGINNLNPATTVNARGNWWGQPSGPHDSIGNPSGQGDAVSSGVDYGSFLSAEPVLTCTMIPVAGYVTQERAIQLQLNCPQAAQYRIAEQSAFSTEPWLDMAGTPTIAAYTLSADTGDKMLYVQFRTAQGSSNTFALAQPITYAPSGPLVQFDQPAVNAVLTQDSLISVSATDPEGITQVELLVNGQRLALLSAPPYQTTWALATVPNGSYTLSARATSTQNLTNTATRQVVVQKENSGAGPSLSASFAGQPLSESANAITEPGTLSATAQSAVGISRIQASVDGVAIFNQSYGNQSSATASQFIDFAGLPNGSHSLSVTATDADSAQTTLTIPFTLTLSAPAAPVITTPANGANLSSAQTAVTGSATPGAQVQLYVDGQSAGSPLAASASGGFAGTLTLGEGVHQLTASASNSRGASAPSAPVSVTYTASAPTLAFLSPADGATLSADTTIEVSASDSAGIAQVQIYVGDQLLATRTSAPWSAAWSVSSAQDGAYTLRAIATNTAGKTTQASRTVTVQKTIAPPPVQAPPYVTQGVAITPALSFGDVPIQISGNAVTSAGGQSVPNASLRMILTVNGFERRFTLVADAGGHFAYTFAPQASDAGTYQVRIVHPDDTTYASEPAAGNFTINRLSVNYNQYTLNAIRGIASAAVLNVSASAGTGATGVHWQALPADQPSGSLPPGITLDVGQSIDIAAGTTVPTSIKLTGDASAGATGTIILKLFANESGATPRAALQLKYQLYEAQPGLTPSPTSLELGVQQGQTASGKITISNKGYSAAQNVKVQLLAQGGGTPPAWAHLVSSPSIGAIDVGASTIIQLDASPDTSVADGYYQMQIKVSADNDPGGSVPVTVAVAQSGQGGVRFQMVDIYTGTLDTQGQSIAGLAGARITLQNQALTNDIRTLSSDAGGNAEFSSIPPGNYSWRASAPNHIDASGRITVYAGLTANQRVFLDYQLVSIQFSVTETTVQDVYDIVLEATYQTQVPAPVVLLEPMSINLPDMQQGEELTGELTLSNYGLVRADNLQYALPTSDENFKYEFFGQLPTQLEAKSRVSIPYKITALQPLDTKGLKVDLQPANTLKKLGAGNQPSAQMQEAIRQFLATGQSSAMAKDATSQDTEKLAAKAASCSSYSTQACAAYDYECAAGDVRSGSACSSISRMSGSSCSASGASSIYNGHDNGGPIGSVWEGGAGGSVNSPIPLVPGGCIPGGGCDKKTTCCPGGPGGSPPPPPPGSGSPPGSGNPPGPLLF